MSSSGPEELIVEDHTPHRGKNIDEYVFSLNMQYIVTWSKDDQSIVGWSITNDLSNDLSIEPINSLNTDDLKSLLNTDNIPYIQLKRASDCKQFIILYFESVKFPKFAVIDITTKSRQILNAQGLKDNKLNDNMDDIAFLKNGDLAIAKTKPIYRAYIFSKLKFNGKYQWTCKNSIELEKYYDYKCKINKNGTLFMHFYTTYVITQWNLTTRKFEMQYILNLNLRAHFTFSWIEMNNDNTLLAIAFYTESWSIAVYVYSIKSGIEIANKSFSDENYDFFNFRKFYFIGSREKERLFISFQNRETKNYVTYILNPLTYTLDVSPDTYVLHDILNQNYEVFNDYIIKIDKNDLSIKKLSQNENWQNHLQSKERYVCSIFFNTKEIKQFILSILERYKSNQFLTQSYSDVSKEYPGETYTWIVMNKYDKYSECNCTHIKAQIKSKLKKSPELSFYSYDNADGHHLEIKVLGNDIIFVSSSGIQIFSVNFEKSSIELIYFWEEDIEYIIRKTQVQESIIKHLISFKNKLDYIEILPTPNFDNDYCYLALKNNELALKLYGKEIIQKSVQTNRSNETNEILDNCYKYSISMFESGDLNNFLLFINQITFALVDLEKFNKNLRATEKFLLKINLLYYRFYKDLKFRDINDSSLLSHLQYYGIYVHSYLSNTSFFDYLFFWISENWNLLEHPWNWFGILVLAFAHSLHILLRPTTEYSYNQPSYTDDTNNPWNLVSTYQFISSNGTIEGSSLVEIPDDNTNMFALFSTSLLAVYFMLTGDSSAVSSWVYKNNWILVFLMVIFSFFTTIYLLNLFITLLGAAVDETNNEESFLQLKCEILSEIELFWMLPYQRRKKNWFPDIFTEDDEIFENLLPSVKNLFPEIKDSNEEIKNTIKTQKDESLKDLKAQMDESLKDLKAQMDESLKDLKTQEDKSRKDLKDQIDESLKDLKDQINELLKDLKAK
ncbi:transient receptor potential cation channel subfamily a member 1-like [Gigaspora margarita]|uniref:Transient receptor potential cation channel subfamily a member 1-like n=1 Tax=Gigaspora margarita TaxID=4874 RepID=A0A8H4A9T4_GIGMA|nr:transient receptor potential cation channel subfamily a member 1-like [Gigaspora margarita]